MRAKLLKIQQLTAEVLLELSEQKELPPKQDMSLREFKGFLRDKRNAAQLAKRCKIGHSVFYDILDGLKRPMRDSTKERILMGLNIVIKDG